MRHLGRLSLALAIASWLLYLGALFLGGIDPSPGLSDSLQQLILATVLICLTSTLLAGAALVRGPQRFSAALALAFGVLFLAVLSGAVWLVLFRL